MTKPRQLSLFTDRHVERSALCRAFRNPTKCVLRAFRFENIYGIFRPTIRPENIGVDRWNVLRHRVGIRTKKMVKERSRYFYE